MIYKLLVNAAFLAAGYYIGKQVGLNQAREKDSTQSRPRPSRPVTTEKTGHTSSVDNSGFSSGDDRKLN